MILVLIHQEMLIINEPIENPVKYQQYIQKGESYGSYEKQYSTIWSN
jgi:hypothetical protein